MLMLMLMLVMLRRIGHFQADWESYLYTSARLQNLYMLSNAIRLLYTPGQCCDGTEYATKRAYEDA